MPTEQETLLYRLRTEGRIVFHAINETIYELDGKRWRYFYVPERDRAPEEGCWRAEPYQDKEA